MTSSSNFTHAFARVALAGFLLGMVACRPAAGQILAAPPPVAAPAAPASPGAALTPNALSFAAIFVVATNRSAAAHHDEARISNADCVEAARGYYMCSYSARRRGHAPECHLMQARWTPRLASTFTITLAGRVKRCATLRQALRSLR